MGWVHPTAQPAAIAQLRTRSLFAERDPPTVRGQYSRTVAGPDVFERIDVSQWPVVAAEPVGAEEKLWLRGMGAEWLFKPVTTNSTGQRQGEDWSEKAAAHLAEHLAVPCAVVELAVREGVEGSLSRNLRPERYDMQAGALFLIDRKAPGFRPARELEDDREAKKRRPGHSLANIRGALDGVFGPPGSTLSGTFDAFDTFVGYLILDAWIGNRDRHDENWSVLVPVVGNDPTRLCGSYDQAGGLGFNLRDDERDRRLLLGAGHDVAAFATRGTAWRFENNPGQPMRTLVEMAVDALELASDAARAHWNEAITRLGFVETSSRVERIEAMSVAARRFAGRLLEINGRRLRDECDRRA